MTRQIPIQVALAVAAVLSSSAAEPLRYNRDIRPILSDNCFHCHGPDKKTRDGGRRLDLSEGAYEDIDGIRALVPGKPELSDAIERIFSDDEDELMPPPKAHKTLTKAQKEILKRWVTEGAKYEPHWAYAPLTVPMVPKIDGAQSAIDCFIQDALRSKNLMPAPEADRRVLIRRLSLDLIGLPPSTQEVDAFVNDADANAYETLVDKLLATPRYGERMAQQWLDLARYSDTVGFHGDQNQNVWAYRDWVIAAFNSNKPFDQFTTEQLAGDLLPNPSPDQLIATCFNRLNMMTREGGAQAKEYLAKYTGDRIRTVATTWLGSTFGCAECHDHKFDPISQKDVYSLGAYFADVKQWGVYSDYKYTPNPDLKGFTNDYPFPPEIVVESDVLKRRIKAAQTRMREIVAASQPDDGKFAEWQKEIGEFLKRNPSGWESPKAAVTVKSAKPEYTQVDDGRIVIEPKETREIQVEFAPSGKQIAVIRLELLRDTKAGKKIVRGEGVEMIKPVFEIVRKGAVKSIEIRHAQANRAATRYDSGYEVLGVQAGWKPSDTTQDHKALYYPTNPISLEAGDTIRARIPENLIASIRVSVSPLAPLDVQESDFHGLKDLSKDAQVAHQYYLRSTAWDAAAFAKLKEADVEVLECRKGKTPVLVTERTEKPLTIRVLPRGDWQNETGEICEPSTPHFLPQLPGIAGKKQTRLDLAKWLMSRENPLTARVVTNRLWRQFFGTGLSAQVDDLGAQGEAPSHPELLDWLATEFRDHGWNMKRMVKLIVMSHTYRQVAGLRPEVREFDPNNRLLSAQNPRRLDAEFVRDNALAISGLLNVEMGGPASKPYQPAKLYADLQFPDRNYVPDKNADQWRRGVYMWWQRTFLHPMLLNFDAPSREDCIAMRAAANTPQQALTLLNDPEFVEAARVWAGKLLTEAKDDPARMDLAFQQALGRPARDEEKRSLEAALRMAKDEFKQRPDDASKLQTVGIAPIAIGDPTELAAWTTLCRIILNLHETITRY